MVGRIEGVFDVFGRRMVLRGAAAGVAAAGAAAGLLKGTFLEGGGGWRGGGCEACVAAGDAPPIIPPMKLFFMWQRIIDPNRRNPSSRIGDTLPFRMYLVYSLVNERS